MGKSKKSLIQKLTSILRGVSKKKKKFRPKNEFRFNHDTGHMTHVFLENDSEYRAVGLTTKEKTFGRPNMPLKKNPKRGGSGKSFARNGIVADNKRSFSSKTAKNFSFSPDDKANIKSKERHFKKEQKRKKK